MKKKERIKIESKNGEKKKGSRKLICIRQKTYYVGGKHLNIDKSRLRKAQDLIIVMDRQNQEA